MIRITVITRALMTILTSAILLLVSCDSGVSLPSSPPSPPVVHVDGGFSNASLRGAYAYGFEGVESTNQHIVAVGLLVFDGSGRITGGSQQRTEDGVEFQFAITGTYSVNSDGTGTVTMNFLTSSVDTWSIVLSAAGQRVRMVNIEPNNFLNGAIVGDMEKQ